jgi:acyl-CoA synthetase (AMP-forming)/AMP-acid ligase II
MSMKMPSVPVDLGFAPTVPNLLRNAVERFGDREFLVDAERRLTFTDVEARSAEIAEGLLALGIGKGTRVALMMPNCADWVLTWLALGRIGAHTIALSTFYRARELSWALRFNDVDTLLMSSGYLKQNYVELLEQAVPELAGQSGTTIYAPSHPYLRHVAVWGDCDRHWAIAGTDGVRAFASGIPAIDRDYVAQVEALVAPADTLFTILTSGSSADPKAVVHTHGTSIRATFGFMDYLDFHGTDRTYTGQPFFWIGGLNINLFPCLHSGAALIFSDSPRLEDIARIIDKEKVTRLSLWAAQIQNLGQVAEREGYDLSSIRTGLSRRRDEYGDLIPVDRQLSAGFGIGLGMTESFGMHSMEKATSVTPSTKGGNWGRHLPGMDRRVIDAVTGREVEPGQQGELYIRGHAMMTGYYKREREETFTRDGYFATGDLVRIDDDDYLFFDGRATEMIKTSGANVAPREVELVAQSYPEVREAIVFGLPDKRKGEIVVCVIVPAAGIEVEIDALRAKLRDDLSAYKVPAEFLLMELEDVPRTGSAKAHKPNLKVIATEKLGLGASDPNELVVPAIPE